VIFTDTSFEHSTLVPFSVNNRLIATAERNQTEARQASGRVPAARETSIADRKLRMLQRSGLFGGNTRGAVIERACSLRDLRAAYRLVHDVYVSTGFIHAEPSGLRLRIFETSADTATFVAKVEGRVVGVLSVVADSSDLGLPSDSAFKPELDRLRSEGFRLCELTNQAIAPEYRKTAIATELMRCAFAHGIKAGFHQSIAAVSPSHDGFYELMGFRRFGSERSYSEKIYDPVIAVAMDLANFRRPYCGTTPAEAFVREFGVEGNPYLGLIGEWNRVARDCFLSVNTLLQLFVRERSFLDECDERELAAIQFRWGRKLFASVLTEGRSDQFTDEQMPIISATIITRSKPTGDESEGFTFLSKEIFVRSLTSCRSRSFHKVRRQPVETSRRSALLLR